MCILCASKNIKFVKILHISFWFVIRVYVMYIYVCLYSFFSAGIHKLPVKWEQASPVVKEKYLEQHYEYKNYSKGPDSIHDYKMNIDEVLKFIYSVNDESCKK